MKQTIKFNRNLFTLSFLFIAFAFVSCEKDEMQDDLSLDKRGGASAATVYGSISYSSNEVCPGNSVTVTFDNEQEHDHGGFHLHVWGPNDSDWVNVNGALSAPSGGKVTYTFEPEFIGDYNFRAQWNRQGGSGVSIGWMDATTPLSVISCCVNNLEANLVCGTTNTLSLSFTAEEDGAIVIQGGLTNGTNITSATSNVLTRNTTHPSVNNSNANVTRWEGNVTACDEVTITIEFTGGNGVGDWSAKRGNDVLGATEAIACQ